ncbi:MAG: hypothetical protein ABI813_15410 [Bacteroidota bacterium]
MRKILLAIQYLRGCMTVILLVMPSGFLPAQVSIQFVPALNGQFVNGLFTALVQNTTTGVYNGKLEITVRDADGRTVLLARTPSFLIRPGRNAIRALAPQTSIAFGNSALANAVAQTGHFPESEYEYCFEWTGTGNKPGDDVQVFENCYNFFVLPVIPLTLVYPGDGDEFCNERPGFNWQPAMPVNGSYRYRVLVTSKNMDQSPMAALTDNLPVLQQDNIPGFMIPYPAHAPGLQKNHTYVWQVSAYEGNRRITQSEIWTFRVNCNDKKPDSTNESYRQLSDKLDGNYYLANTTLHFSVVNPYSFAILRYSITELADPHARINNLPPIKIGTGLNKIDIGLQEIKGIQPNRMYLLKVENMGEHIQYLQFIYKGDETQQ